MVRQVCYTLWQVRVSLLLLGPAVQNVRNMHMNDLQAALICIFVHVQLVFYVCHICADATSVSGKAKHRSN